ncbi:hypothetical protein [Candidatus Solirubrobacter pratensis]|uniref:hypothetical protein n=1 Tax=Candidatus Solirubrobacter pratensis TaxID=1298857 RepID=UPI000480BFE7|nr:hypothetical protein [Candidatus Solirubrobacter pratensis]
MPSWDGEEINVVDGRRIERTCIICHGTGLEEWWEGGDPRKPHEYCGGRGRLQVSRLEMIWRDRRHGQGPGYDKDGKEKYVRIALDVPPEIGALIDAYIAHRKRTDINYRDFNRARFARIAILEMLDREWPEQPEAIEATAVDAEAVELPLEAGPSEATSEGEAGATPPAGLDGPQTGR